MNSMMDDYIAVLLNEMEEHWSEFMNGSYFLEEARKKQAARALMDALTEAQTELFLAYEERQSALAVLREEVMTRQAFLLAREMFR